MTFLNDYSHEIIVGMASCICTGVGAYLVVGQQLSFVKGQLSQLLRLEKRLDDTATRVEGVIVRTDKQDLAIARAHTRIDRVETSLPPFSLHPKK